MAGRIVSKPKIQGGKPIIQGTRISVEVILELFASGGKSRGYPGNLCSKPTVKVSTGEIQRLRDMLHACNGNQSEAGRLTFPGVPSTLNRSQRHNIHI